MNQRLFQENFDNICHVFLVLAFVFILKQIVIKHLLRNFLPFPKSDKLNENKHAQYKKVLISSWFPLKT